MSANGKQSRSGSSAASSLHVRDLPGAFPDPDVYTPVTVGSLSLQEAVHARRAEYVQSKSIRVKVGTWNVAAFKGAEKDIGAWFVEGKGISEALTGLDIAKSSAAEPSSKTEEETADEQESRFSEGHSSIPQNDSGIAPNGDSIDLYLLGLQEIIDISSASEALRPFTDPNPAAKWKAAIAEHLSDKYVLVAEQQLQGLLLLAYASPRVAPDVSAVSTTSVGVGVMGVMGNKGAVTARIVLGDTTRLAFVNVHLAAGADKPSLERRNWDYSRIMASTKFDPISSTVGLQQKSGETIDDADFAFVVGDLNYRITDIPADDIRRLLMLHTRDEYDLSQPSSAKIEREIEKSSADSSGSASLSSRIETDGDDKPDPCVDPTSVQTTINSLLFHDELQQQMKSKKAFHEGWREGPITFLPTYKYDHGSVGVFDSSEKQRAPSWCDRILYRSRRDRLRYESRAADEKAAQARDEQMKKSGLDQARNDEDLLYDYDPDAEEQDEEGYLEDPKINMTEAPDNVVVTTEGFTDELHLDAYTSHQRVISSDHKPLHALFTLSYEAIDPDRKSKVQAEVARELDKAENDGRPSITIDIDNLHGEQTEEGDEEGSSSEGVYFGHLRYHRAKHRSLTIANTGRISASISFVDRPVGAGQVPGRAPIWLDLSMAGQHIPHGPTESPYTVTLEPGDTFAVDLQVSVKDASLVRQLNEGTMRLDDILVLRVENGRDHFIPVYGKWQQTVLGKSIDRLIRLPESGIRRLQSQHPDDRSKDGDSSVKCSAPRELFRLTEALENLTLACVDSWAIMNRDQDLPCIEAIGWPFQNLGLLGTLDPRESTDFPHKLCAALDEYAPLPECFDDDASPQDRLEQMAAFTVEFIQDIEDGIVTSELWSEIEQSMNSWDHGKEVVDIDSQRATIQEILLQSPAHSISFVLVTSALDRIVGEICKAAKGRLEAERRSAQPAPSRLGSLRRKSPVKDPYTEYYQKTVRTMASTLGAAMVHAEPPSKGRSRTMFEERRARLVELFLTRQP